MGIGNRQKLGTGTGGTSGIGMAITEKLVGQGIRTIVIGRNREKLKAAENQFRSLCKTIAFDLDDLTGITALVKKIHGEFGPNDILINNANINQKKEFSEVTDGEFQKILLTNVAAIFSMSRETVKSMLAENIRGSIINISSMASQYGIPKVIAHTASESAIEGMTRAMAAEPSPKGVRVNGISPGFISTEMSVKDLGDDPERKQKAMSRTPMGRF